MRIKSTLRYRTAGILALFTFSFLNSLSAPVYGMTIGHSENPAVGAEKTSTSAKPQSKPVSFIAWEGNRLITTAGAFVITKSVRLLDLAGSRYLAKGFKGPAPSVHLTFRDRKLVKVVIK